MDPQASITGSASVLLDLQEYVSRVMSLIYKLITIPTEGKDTPA